MQVRDVGDHDHPSDTLSLDNGGDLRQSLLDVKTPSFGLRLPGPFITCADIGLSPVPDSLNLASVTTFPVHSLFTMELLPSILQ